MVRMKYNYPRSHTVKKQSKKMVKTWIISPGHGINTPGKCAPDKSFYEWKFNRKLVDRIAYYAEKEDIPLIILDYEDNDTSLGERVRKANKLGKNCCYMSIHVNAAGNGSKWMSARGWSIFTSKGFTKADPIAQIFVEEADKLLPIVGSKVRRYSWKKYEQDFEENFYVLRNTIMPAILTENLFMDNKKDLEILQTEEGLDLLAQVHINAMKRVMEAGL